MTGLTVTSAQTVSVTGGGRVDGSITAAKSANVMSMGATGSGSIGGSASNSGGVTATISAAENVTISTLGGTFDGSATASRGNVTVFAGQDASGGISAGDSAFVRAIGNAGGQQGSVSGVNGVKVSALGTVDGTITSSAGSVAVYAGEEVKGTITALKDAAVTSATAGMSAIVTSTASDIHVSALGEVSGDLTAFRDADVFTLREISNNISTTSGSISAVTWGGKISGSIASGQHASLIGFLSVTAPITAAGSVNLFSGGFVDAMVGAGENIGVSTLGSIDGILSAGESVFVTSFGRADLTSVTATNGSVLVSSPQSVDGVMTNRQGTNRQVPRIYRLTGVVKLLES